MIGKKSKFGEHAKAERKLKSKLKPGLQDPTVEEAESKEEILAGGEIGSNNQTGDTEEPSPEDFEGNGRAKQKGIFKSTNGTSYQKENESDEEDFEADGQAEGGDDGSNKRGDNRKQPVSKLVLKTTNTKSDTALLWDEIMNGINGKNSGIPMGFNRLNKYIGLRKSIYTLIGAGTG